jgi:hypothetical protein
MKIHHAFFLLSTMLPAVGLAQGMEGDLTHGRFEFRVGGQIFSSFTSRARVDSEILGPGTEFEFENVTDLEEQISIGRLDGRLRFSDRHSMAFSYYDIARTGGKSLETEIEWEGDVYPIGIAVESRFEQQVLKLSYAFNFFSRPRSEMGFSFGVHTMDFGLGLRAANSVQASSADATAPLPVLGLTGQYRIGNKWRFVGSVEWLDVTVGDYQGVFSDTLLSIEHDTFDRFGFGIGLNSSSLDIEARSGDLTGLIDLGFDSAVVYFRGSLGRSL